MDFSNLLEALVQRGTQVAAGYTGGKVEARKELAAREATQQARADAQKFQQALLTYREGAIDNRAGERNDAAEERQKAQIAAEAARQAAALANARLLVGLRAAASSGTLKNINPVVQNYVHQQQLDNEAVARQDEADAATETDPQQKAILLQHAKDMRDPSNVAAMAEQRLRADAANDPSTAPLLKNPLLTATIRGQAQNLLVQKPKPPTATSAGIDRLMGTGVPAPGTTAPSPAPIVTPGPTASSPPTPKPVPVVTPPSPPGAGTGGSVTPGAPVGGSNQPNLPPLSAADIARAGTDPGFRDFLRQQGYSSF